MEQTEKKPSRKMGKFIIVAVIAFIIIKVISSLFGSDPCKAAENAVEGLGYKILDSRVIADANSDLEAQGYDGFDNNVWLVAVKCRDSDSNTYTLCTIVADSFDEASIQSSIAYMGVETASGTLIGKKYEDIPEMTYAECEVYVNSLDKAVRPNLQYINYIE